MAKLSSALLKASVEVECPKCGFVLSAELLDAYRQVWRWCPCCRCRIRLAEPDGSLYGAMEEVDSVMGELQDSLKRMFG